MNPSRLTDLPERVLPRDVVVGIEGPEVAPAHLDPLVVGRGSGQSPLRRATVPTREMLIVAVVDIGDSCESRRKSLAHSPFSNEPPTPRVISARGLEDAVVTEARHDRI